MNAPHILFPVFALIVLTFLVWCQMYVIRLSQAKKHSIDPQDMTADNPKLPKSIVTSGDNLRNLFELPVLFYFAALLTYTADISDHIYIFLSWGFVTFRIVHSLIHTTYNRVIHRFLVYIVSSLFLWAMLGRLMLHFVGLV